MSDDKFVLLQGDCLEVLKELPDNSIDSLVTDPPAGIAFMGKSWDEDKGGRKQWISWLSDVMKEALRVLKPGAHGLVWAIPRTSHWTATALEDAGFEIRDVVTHLFGSGFPKSHNIPKAIDAHLGVEREVLGTKPAGSGPLKRGHVQSTGGGMSIGTERSPELEITEATSPEAKTWQGWGTALKPASEHWVLVRKPLEHKHTVAANVLKHGTGGINIDASRIEAADQAVLDAAVKRMTGNKVQDSGGTTNFVSGSKEIKPNSAQGRFPANLVLSHNEDCYTEGFKPGELPYGPSASCTEGCAVAILDAQSGTLKSGGGIKAPIGNKVGNGNTHGKMLITVENKGIGGDSGGASRFFLCVKPENEDLCGLENIKAEDTYVGRKIVNKNDNLSIVGSGNKSMDQYLLGTISITRMKTHSIMTFPILSVLSHMLIGTCTIESEKIINTLTELSIENVKIVSNTEVLITLKDGQQELIKGTVSTVLNSNYSSGESATANIITPIIELTDKSRFFYCAKASKSDKNAGLDTPSTHPTIKSTKLMSYLITLITPPNGVVLDPFTGSGTTGVSALKDGFKFVGIEQSEEYITIAEKRLLDASNAKTKKSA